MTTVTDVVRVRASVQARRFPMSALVAALLILATAGYATSIWLDYTQAWVHPEEFAVSAYIWNFPYQQGFGDRLRKVLDWKAFDPNVNRVRPLNDLGETLDAITRPVLAEVAAPHPSMTIVGLLAAVLTPALLFGYLRLVGFDHLISAGVLIIFISSIGFLSVIVPEIHPAKKVTLLFLALGLYFGQRHARSGSSRTFVAAVVSVFVGLFADEMALASYIFCGALIPALFIRAANWKRVVYLAIPPLFIVSVWWLLPTLYADFSVHGTWNALGDAKKLQLVDYLLEPNFYAVSLTHIATVLLTTLGIGLHTTGSEVAAMVLFIGATLWFALPFGTLKGDSARLGIVASALCLIAGGIYTTLLDWYPFPEAVSYLGSFTFYYHSSLNVLVVLWLAFVWQRVLHVAGGRSTVAGQSVLSAGVALCAVMTIANFQLFQNVNQMVQLLHTYPYSSAELHSQIVASLPEIRSATADRVVTMRFQRDPSAIDRRFESAARAVFGSDWQNNDFYRTFIELHANPIMKDDHPAALLHAYFPYVNFAVEVYSPDGQLVAGTRPTEVPLAQSASGPAAPSGLRTAPQGSDILLMWEAVPDATEIHIERRDTPGADFREVGVVGQGATGHLNTGLQLGVVYTWRLRACNIRGCSGYTAPVSATRN